MRVPLDPCSRCRRHVVRGRACPFCARRGELVFGVAIVASLTAASCDRKPEDGPRDDGRDMRAEYGVARPPPDAGVAAPSRDPVQDLLDDLTARPMQKYGVPRPPIVVPSGGASANASAAPPKSTKPPGDPFDF